MGNVMPVMSTSWKASVPRSEVGTCPVMQTMGDESVIAVAMPVTKLVAPGPEVAMATPTLPETLAYPSAACPAALLVSHQNVMDFVILPRMVGVHNRTTRYTEGYVHALVFQHLPYYLCACSLHPLLLLSSIHSPCRHIPVINRHKLPSQQKSRPFGRLLLAGFVLNTVL